MLLASGLFLQDGCQLLFEQLHAVSEISHVLLQLRAPNASHRLWLSRANRGNSVSGLGCVLRCLAASSPMTNLGFY